MKEWKKWFAENEKEIQEDFFTFLRFQSVSSELKYKKEVEKNGKWLASYLKKMGMEAACWETSTYPVIFGSKIFHEEYPTVLFYHHYDVQPADPFELWDSPPFDPVIREGDIYARGASDNKGQCFYTIQAIRAFLALSKKRVNVKIVIEGEEEVGSEGLMEVLESKKEMLSADHLFVIDSHLPSKGVPGVALGVRGIVTMEVTCRNSFADLHSGMHGGIALNPNRVLVQLLSSLWDEKGRVAIPNFYDGVTPLSSEEREKLDFTFDKKEYESAFGVKVFANEEGVSIKESNVVRPTLEINGMWGGYTGDGFKTIIPKEAHAKLSCRLVAGQDPQTILLSMESFFRKQLPEGMEVSILCDKGAKAVRRKASSPTVQVAAKAYERVMGEKCRLVLCGGSVPVVAELESVLEADVVMMGFGLDSDHIHAPNEHFGWDRFYEGFLTVVDILHLLSEEG